MILAKTMRIVPQARAGIVERFGKYNATLPAGLNIVVPFVDKVRYMIDLREQVVSFPPQPVITEDNLVVSIDTVIYFQVTDPVAATYEIANYIQAVEQLTMTTLRNIVGGMDLEQTLTSREEINAGLRGVLDEATGKWGIRVNRVEIKGIDPPPSIKDAMEKQMRADRDKRAVILTAEGQRQSAILTAEGNKQSAILNAEGEREAADPRAPRPTARRGSCGPRVRGRPSRRSSRPSTTASRTSRCWPTSTSRCCRRSPRATRTRSGSCRARSARRSRGSGSTIGQIPGIPQGDRRARARGSTWGPSRARSTRARSRRATRAARDAAIAEARRRTRRSPRPPRRPTATGAPARGRRRRSDPWELVADPARRGRRPASSTRWSGRAR